MKRDILVLISVLFAIIGAACTGNPQSTAKPGPRSWIDAPLPGTNLPLAHFQVLSHSTDPAHIAQIELSVNGGVVRTDPASDLAATLVTTKQQWIPPGPGNYTLMVRAQNAAGAWGDYAQAVVTIGGGGVVQGVVYSDLNGNGLPNDVGDAPLDGVVVTLTGCSTQTATTAADGAFHFTALPAGTCLVQVTKPGWKFSGTSPAGIGYPTKAASDPAKPTAFSLYMTLLATPTAAAQPSPTSPPTAVPSLTPSQTPLPAAGIAFYADQTNLVAGQCTTMHWQVTNASRVLLDNERVLASNSRKVCPLQTITHSLIVVTLDNQTVQRSITITVVLPSPTPTSVPPTFTATPLPTATFTPTPVGCQGMPVISLFSANPTAIPPNGSTTLSWGLVSNASSVEIDNGIGGVPTPGSVKVSLKQTTTFTLTAFCGSNRATRRVTVTVARGIVPMPGMTLLERVEMWLGG